MPSPVQPLWNHLTSNTWGFLFVLDSVPMESDSKYFFVSGFFQVFREFMDTSLLQTIYITVPLTQKPRIRLSARQCAVSETRQVTAFTLEMNVYTAHSARQPATEHIRFLTKEQQNFHWVFLEEEDINSLSLAMQPQQKLKDGGRPSWRIWLPELKHKASGMHKQVRFTELGRSRMGNESLTYTRALPSQFMLVCPPPTGHCRWHLTSCSL